MPPLPPQSLLRPIAATLFGTLAGTTLLVLTLPLSRSVQAAQDEHLSYVRQKRERDRHELQMMREELGRMNEEGVMGQGPWMDWVDFD
jgi:hypothetical protein